MTAAARPWRWTRCRFLKTGWNQVWSVPFTFDAERVEDFHESITRRRVTFTPRAEHKKKCLSRRAEDLLDIVLFHAVKLKPCEPGRSTFSKDANYRRTHGKSVVLFLNFKTNRRVYREAHCDVGMVFLWDAKYGTSYFFTYFKDLKHFCYFTYNFVFNQFTSAVFYTLLIM